jgi:hypothetical protein
LHPENGVRTAPRPPQSGHFYLARKRTFLLGLDIQRPNSAVLSGASKGETLG